MLAETQIITLAKPLVEAPVRSYVAKLRLPFQVSKVVRKQAKKRTIVISARQVRKLMKTEPIAELTSSLASDDAVERAALQLAWTMPGDDVEERRQTARIVIGLIFWGYLWVLEPAVAQSHAALTNQIGRLEAALADERARVDDRVGFEDNLQQFSEILRDLAVNIRARWPRMETVVRELTVPATRSKVVQQWSEVKPDWLVGAPSDVYVWLALVASGSDDGTASFRLWDEAVRAGAYPVGVAVGYAARNLALTDPVGARAYIAQHPNDHPFTSAALAGIDKDIPAFLAALERWQPEEKYNASVKALLVAAGHVEHGDGGRAVALALQCWKDFRSTAAALLAVHVLLARAQQFDSVGRVADAQQAVELALAARDDRRTFGGDSAEAVDFALVGLILLHDAERAWKLAQAPPIGEATQDEARDCRVRGHAGLAAAMTGRIKEARHLAAELDGFARAHIEAVLAEWVGDGAAARKAWALAWDSATNDVERLQAASGLVHAGAPLPDLGNAREAFPGPAETLDALAAANASDDPITYLRAKALTSPGILVELADRLSSAKRFGEAAKALDEGAVRWSHPVLAIMAARFYLQEGEWQRSADCARKSLTYGGPSWAGRKQAFTCIIEAEAGRQHWADAAAAAEQLLSESPGDVEAVWALAIALYNDARPEQAWKTLTRSGKPLRPRRQHEVIAWLRLVGRYDSSSSALNDAFELIRDWTEDEKVFGTFVQVLLSPTQLKFEVTNEQGDRIRQAIATFLEAFPNSTMARAFETGPDDDPLQPVAHIMREAAKRSGETQERVARGELPLGALSAAVGRTYAEASLQRAARAVLAENHLRSDSEALAAANFQQSTCVLDATTAHTLVLLDDQTRTKLLGTAGGLIITDDAFRDALAASETLRTKSTLTVGWNTDTDRPVVSEISDADAAMLSERADQLVSVLGSIARVPHSALDSFPDFNGRTAFEERALPWLGAVDLAKSEGYVLWSDDRVLRQLAESMGVQAVGTIALLDALHKASALTGQERTVALASLLSNFYVDLRFDREEYELALAMTGLQPSAVANALSRPAAWAEPAPTLDFALGLLQNVPAHEPLWLQAWCSASASGLLAVATGSIEMCSNNLAVFLGRCVAASWTTRSTVPFVLTGIRQAMRGGADQPLRDPLESALRQLHAAAVASLGYAGAKVYILDFVAECRPEDKQTAARVILTAPR